MKGHGFEGRPGQRTGLLKLFIVVTIGNVGLDAERRLEAVLYYLSGELIST